MSVQTAARRSYGTGQLYTRTNSAGIESWYGKWRVDGRRVNRIPEDIGWYIVARGDDAALACPDCVTQDERDHAAIESVEALRWQRLLKGEDA